MFGVRVLGVATAYSIVLLEVYSGAIKGPLWWVLPGGLVIALLMALSLFGFKSANPEGQSGGAVAVVVEWALVLGAAFAMSWFANYFGRELLPGFMTS